MHQQQLPFPANQLIQAGQLQFLPQLNVMPQMQPFIQPAAQFLLTTLTNHAQRNALRVFLYNQLSANGYNNPDFGPALLGVMEYAQMLLMQQPMQPEQALAASAEAVCGWLAAVNVKKYQALYQYIDQATAADVERKVGEFLQVQQRLGGGQPQQQVGYGNMPQRNQQVQPINNAWAGGQQNFQNQAAAFASNSGMVANPWTNNAPVAPATTPLDVTIGSGKFKPQQQPVAAITFGPGTPLKVDTQFMRTAQVAHAPAVAAAQPEPVAVSIKKPEVVIGQVALKTQKVAEDGVKEIIIDHCPVRFAASSGWVRTPTFDAPYPIAYDPITHAAFHKRLPDGTVVEFLVDIEEMTPEMDYLTHELKPCFREVHATVDDKIVVPNWRAVELLKPAAEVLAVEEALGGDTEAVKVLALPKVFSAYSDSHADVQAQLELQRMGVDVADEPVVEYYYNRNEAYVVGTDVSKIMAAIADTDDICDAALSFTRIKDLIPNRTWYKMHEAVTAKINEALCVNMQLAQWSIESFVDDVADLIEKLRTDKGELFASAFELNAGKIIAAAFRALPNDSSEWDDVVGEFASFKGDENQSLLVMAELCSTTLVNWRSTEIRIRLETTGSAVMESSTPVLYHAIRSIIERSEKHPGAFTDHFIITTDNVKLKLHRGYIGQDFFLISKA